MAVHNENMKRKKNADSFKNIGVERYIEMRPPVMTDM